MTDETAAPIDPPDTQGGPAGDPDDASMEETIPIDPPDNQGGGTEG